MTGSRYEKYVVRKTQPAGPENKMGGNRIGNYGAILFTKFHPALSRNQYTMLEFAWIVKDCAFGVTQDRGPHKHNCDEIFLFMGTNPEDQMISELI